MTNEFFLLGQSTSLLEFVAMITGIIGVWLTMKQSVWCFPVGIVNVALYAWLFMTPGVRLYADAILQCIYVFLLLFGWITWASGKNNILHPARINKKASFKVVIVVILSTTILAFFLQRFTDASYPWLDSLLTCTSLAAQWMIAKKYIENWIVWIAADIFYLPLYIVKNLPLTAILYAIFLALAFKGYNEWKKNLTVYEG